MTEKAQSRFVPRPTIREVTITALQDELRRKVWKLKALEEALLQWPCACCGGDKGNHDSYCGIGRVLHED